MIKLAPRTDVKKPVATRRPEPLPAPAPKAKGSLASKFQRDELSLGRGKKLGELLKKRDPDSPLEELVEHLHDRRTASHLRDALNLQLVFKSMGPPLFEGGPTRGKDGRWHAPNGDPLIEVQLGRGKTALVDPKTNEFYLRTTHPGFRTMPTVQGPAKLPANTQFTDEVFTQKELRDLEQAANPTVITSCFPKALSKPIPG